MRKSFVGGLCAAFLAGISPLYGFDYDPWFRNLYEVELVASGTFVNYRSIEQDGASLPYNTDEQWARFSGGGVITPWLRIESEIEAIRTPRSGGDVAFVGVIMQALLLHDVIGDPVTCVIGASVYGSPMGANPSVIYHGRIGGEISLVLGKEFGCWPDSQVRVWSVVRAGMADKGDPWAGLRGQMEKFFCDGQRLEIWIEGLVGFGKQDFPLLEDFEGYSPLRHRSIDLGVGYHYDLPYLLELFFLGQRRVFAENCPERVWELTIGVLYPFSL